MLAQGTYGTLERYEVIGDLGRGGFASVHLARDRVSGRQVALKLSDPGGDRELLARALAEARATASISHPSLVEIHDSGALPDGRIFVAMAHIDGVTLEQLLEREGRLPPERAVALAVQALSALERVHAHGVVHRDIKPANLLVRRDAQGGDHLFVIDFGISKIAAAHLAGAAPGTELGAVLGTPGYMAPEQLDARTVDPRADVYGVAAVLYRALSGRKPYETATIDAWIRAVREAPPPPLVQVAPHVSPALAQVIDRALARDRDARPQSARALRDALDAALTLESVLASSSGQGAPTATARYVEHAAHFPPQAALHAPPQTWASPVPAATVTTARGTRRPLAIVSGIVIALLAGALVWVLVALRDAEIAASLAPRSGGESASTPAPATPRASAVENEKIDDDVDLDDDTIDREIANTEREIARALEEASVSVRPLPARPARSASSPTAPAPTAGSAPTPGATPAQGEGAPTRVRFVSAQPVGAIEMDEIRGFVRRALPGIQGCHTRGGPARTHLLMLFNTNSGPMVSPLSDRSDLGRCTAMELMSVIPGRGTRSQGVLRDIVFVWE